MSLKPGDFVITDRLPAAPKSYEQENEQRFRRILELTRFQGGGGTTTGVRTTTVVTTAGLDPCETENGVMTLGYKSAMMLIVSATYPCRIRLYPTAALRTDDVGRATWELPAAGSGVLLDAVIGVAGDTIDLSPATYVYNGDNPVVDGIYYAIENRDDVARAVDVTFTYIGMEA